MNKSHYVEQARYNKALQVAEQLDLTDLLTYVLKTNPSASGPYHNNQHLLTVANNTYDAGLHYNLSTGELTELYVAALFHDYNHSLGVHDDAVNIPLAIEGFMVYCQTQTNNFTMEQKLEVLKLIMATNYPHMFNTTNLKKQIIMDSDILQTLEPDSINFINGLYEETGLVVTPLSNIAFITSNIITQWAEKKLANYLTPY